MNLPRIYIGAVITLFSTIVLLPIAYMFLSPFLTDQVGLMERLFNLFDSRQLSLAGNSLRLAAGTACLSLVVGVPFAFICRRTNVRGKRFFGLVFIIPFLIPPYIHAVVWIHVSRFIENYFSFDIYSLSGAIFVLTCAYFPFVVLMTLAGLAKIDRNLEESSLMVHGKCYTLCRITFPLILPHIISGAIFVFIFSIVNVSVPDFLRVRAYPLEIFIQFSAFYDQVAATLLALPLICLTFILIAMQKKYMADRSYVQISGGKQKCIMFQLGRFHSVAFIFCLIVFVTTAVLPVVVLAFVAGPFETYINAINTSFQQIGYSLVVAFSGSVATLIIGFLLAYYIERSKGKLRWFVSWAVFLPFAIPATSIGICLIGVWNRAYVDIIYSSSLIIIIGYVARFIPFAVLILLSGLTHVGHNLEEVAILTGSSFVTIFKKIVIPLSKQTILAVLFIIFILSFGELGTTLLIIPPGRETIPIKIYNLMHYGADQLVAALCLILITLILSISGFFLLCSKRLAGGS